MVSLEEFQRANERGKAKRASGPVAIAAHYDVRAGKVVIEFEGGLGFVFPPNVTQGLEDAASSDLRSIEISASGQGLHFPKLDADLYIPSLLQNCFGSKKWAAERLGASGGAAKSVAKSQAARRNGKLGGRPRKNAVA